MAEWDMVNGDETQYQVLDHLDETHDATVQVAAAAPVPYWYAQIREWDYPNESFEVVAERDFANEAEAKAWAEAWTPTREPQ